MCGPTAIAVVSIASTVVGGYMQYQAQRAAANAQQQQYQAQANQYEYQAAVNRNNAIIAERQAADARARGEEEVAQHREKVQQIKSRQTVGFAANNIDLSSDVVADTLFDTDYLGELDAKQIRSNAAREAYGYEVDAYNFETQAGLNDQGAASAMTAKSNVQDNSFQTILGTASTVSNSYLDLRSKGAFQ